MKKAPPLPRGLCFVSTKVSCPIHVRRKWYLTAIIALLADRFTISERAIGLMATKKPNSAIAARVRVCRGLLRVI